MSLGPVVTTHPNAQRPSFRLGAHSCGMVMNAENRDQCSIGWLTSPVASGKPLEFPRWRPFDGEGTTLIMGTAQGD